jgi:[acyl-carrier-protein] S-malonyltransferase
MGRSLAERSPAARELYDEAKSLLGYDLGKVSFEGPEPELTQTKICQPALFVHGLAVHAALKEAGKLPPIGCALGLSLGELTAITAAGACNFATGLKLVAERARLMQEACERTTGSMAAIIGESKAAVEGLCRDFDIEAANFNAPGQIIVSGEKAKVGAAVAAAKERGMKKVVPLNVAGAYHSRLMEPGRAAFAATLAAVPFVPPRFAVYSNTTAAPVRSAEEIRTALAKQVVSPVLWEDCMRAAAAAGMTQFWELGPGAVLAGLARRTDKAWTVKSFAEMEDVTSA